MKRKMKGFTLIEMIITITVIIILSAISVPIYKNYQQDAILAEGYMLLGVIREAQKNYYSEWGNFLYRFQSSSGGSYGSDNYTANETVLGIDARGNKYFTAFVVNISPAGTGKIGYYCQIQARKPNELLATSGTAMILQYNITLGQHFVVDYDKDYDSSWT